MIMSVLFGKSLFYEKRRDRTKKKRKKLLLVVCALIVAVSQGIQPITTTMGNDPCKNFVSKFSHLLSVCWVVHFVWSTCYKNGEEIFGSQLEGHRWCCKTEENAQTSTGWRWNLYVPIGKLHAYWFQFFSGITEAYRHKARLVLLFRQQANCEARSSCGGPSESTL